MSARRYTIAIFVATTACGRVAFDPLATATDGSVATDAACTWTPFSTPVKLGGQINSATDDWDAMPTQNNAALYFHSFRASPHAGGNIWVSRPAPSAATEVSEVNSDGQDLVVMLSEDGLVMMFTSDRVGGAGGYDLWQTSRVDPLGAFAPPTPVTELNDSLEQFDPWLSADGLELWFLSGPTTTALTFHHTSRPDRSSPFAPPTVASELTAPGTVQEPTLTNDQLDIWFASDRAGGLGGFDIWTAHRDRTDLPFGTPHDVPELNSAAHESGPRLSHDGTTMHLVYDGPSPVAGDGTADLWVATRTCQ